MLEWIESHLWKWMLRFRFLLMRRVHPELARLDREKDREWALWFALDDAPRWQRIASLTAMLVGGPVVLITVLVMLVHVLHWRPGVGWAFLLIGAWVLGFIASAAALDTWRSRGAGRACYRALRLFGYDVCQQCGYEMQGHICDASKTPRTCPECGAAVATIDDT